MWEFVKQQVVLLRQQIESWQRKFLATADISHLKAKLSEGATSSLPTKLSWHMTEDKIYLAALATQV